MLLEQRLLDSMMTTPLVTVIRLSLLDRWHIDNHLGSGKIPLFPFVGLFRECMGGPYHAKSTNELLRVDCCR